LPLLIDALVFGNGKRVSSLTAPEVVQGLIRDQAGLVEKFQSGTGKGSLLGLARKVLGSHTLFGRIVRKGLDADNQRLEDTWYYDAALDPDKARATTLMELAPRPSKRKASMGDRTYYYAPIDMNRWVVAAEEDI